MEVIYDPQTAQALLSRQSPCFPRASEKLRQRIKEIFGQKLSLEEVVEQIIQEVREKGDSALLKYTELIDGTRLDQLEVSSEKLEEACQKVNPQLSQALELAAERISSFHKAQKVQLLEGELEKGTGLLIRSLERVGSYIPGGAACYPSTVLMTVIPAKVAGVKEIILTTPPKRDDFLPLPTLAAARIAGVARIFKLGGAQAIAALAFGTESVPKVDKICGPGNIFVTLAKKKVYGFVDIDGLQGPTETIILADDSANPSLCAADLITQAEHDELATAILLTNSTKLAEKVEAEVDCQLEELEDKTARLSLEQRGKIVVTHSLDEAIQLVNLYAPEHLSLMVQQTSFCLERIQNAGAIFVGENSPEALGDYLAGPSHVLPTGGTARFGSPLNVIDFLKFIALVNLGEEELQKLGPAAAAIARAEGLLAHARAVERRLNP